MPKRNDIKTILLLGAGPIVIGQGCEFDYSGSQACVALREEGYRVVLVNSNPATIMTDPDMADRTYIEPIQWEVIETIIAKEKPCALLPTMGGQTALNCALDLVREGVLDRYGVELIGAKPEVIDCAEDREQFRQAMDEIGLMSPRSGIAHTMDEAWAVVESLGYPVVIRPSFTLGGSGGGIAYNRDEFVEICSRGFTASPTQMLLIDESLLGWKEYELEVVRDTQDNCLVVCSIENLDPMGVHTGDSITVAPSQTLTDQEYQRMRSAAIAVLRRVGVTTGGANVQFAVNPKDGRMVVIEMNPRVSRSSALASKATGFPIARVAAKLAIGYTLPELSAGMIGAKIPASFEPTLDYVVTKIPRFNFDKFPDADGLLTTQMQSVGEVMALGTDFQSSLQKAIRSLEMDCAGLKLSHVTGSLEVTLDELSKPRWDRLWWVAHAFRSGAALEMVHQRTAIDPWFLQQIQALVAEEAAIMAKRPDEIDASMWRTWKKMGFGDHYIADLMSVPESTVRAARLACGVRPAYKRVDSCAAEFACDTQFYYATFDEHSECLPSDRPKVMVLGSGPNRIGQGIEFDYCCVHAALALREAGYEAIMVNCNPETVSTDPQTSDRLYFEPLTFEDVMAIVDQEQPKGVIVHFGGQTPLKLTDALQKAGVSILGTSPEAISQAEDRQTFARCLDDLGLLQPAQNTICSTEVGQFAADQYAYPVLVRPSFVLGGRGMAVLHDADELRQYLANAKGVSPQAPLLIDRFLDHAIELDVDCIADGKHVVVAGLMEHIEEAGIHSGDSICCTPPHSLTNAMQEEVIKQAKMLAKHLRVIGLMNVQFAIQGQQIYVLEVNPRASRTIPYLSKVVGVPLAKVATRCKCGISLAEQGLEDDLTPAFYAVKLPIFPFDRFPKSDPVLGPEMRSTGEVVGIGNAFAVAFGRGQWASGRRLPSEGRVLMTVCDHDKPMLVGLARDLQDMGFVCLATQGTADYLRAEGVDCELVMKVHEGRPHIVDCIKNGDVGLIINTTFGRQSHLDSAMVRQAAVQAGVCYTTTMAGAAAIVAAIAKAEKVTPNPLQFYESPVHNTIKDE